MIRAALVHAGPGSHIFAGIARTVQPAWSMRGQVHINSRIRATLVRAEPGSHVFAAIARIVQPFWSTRAQVHMDSLD